MMFCNEPIICVYERRYYGGKEQSRHTAILRLTGNFEYHTTEGYWLVLQTDNFVISMGYDGVKKYHSMDEFCTEDELDPLFDIDGWITTEETLFVGERICSVDKIENGWVVTFDHFRLHLYGYHESNARDIDQYSNATNRHIPLSVGTHLLKRKCTCGREGEIYLDFVGDYFVRCNNCHASTWSEMCLIYAVDEWNNSDLIPIEELT